MCGCWRRAARRISRWNRSAPSAGGDLGVEDLERDRPVVAQVAGEVDSGHAAAAELALDEVAITECCGQRGVDCGHQSCRVGEGLESRR